MPTIKLLPKRDKVKTKRFDKKPKNYKKSGKQEMIHKLVYCTERWRKLRLAYIIEHPLCEECLKNGKTVPATEVHHQVPISKGQSELEIISLGFDAKNLMALCEQCHHQIHKKP